MAHLQYMPGDPRLVDQLVYELKSKGIFDQFRKDCIADVDTRPAYQNLRQRVENSVSAFLSRQCWKPDLNKNQLREKLRKHILDGNYLEQGVERIVDQVVNPKIASVFIPQVEDLVYNYLGVPRKKTNSPETSNGKVSTEDLLPTDLEAVSPGSVKSNDDKNEAMDHDISEDTKMEIEETKEVNKEEEDKTEETELSKEANSPSSTSNNCVVILNRLSIPTPSESIRIENIPPPDNSPPKVDNVDLEKIELPKEPYVHLTLGTSDVGPDDIPLPKDDYFKPLQLNSEDDSSSDSSLRRNMSPLTPIRNYNNENSCDAQQAFENDSDSKSNDKKEPSSFRFAIGAKSPCSDEKEKKDEDQINLSSQFNTQVNINTFATPLYDDSSNSNNLQIDYESDVNSKATTEKLQDIDQESEDKKDKKSDDKKTSHKSSHRSRDSHRHSSSKDKRSESKQSTSRDSSRHDKKSKDDHSKSKSSHKERERSKDRGEKKDSRDSSRHKSSHKSSSHRDSKSHRSSSSSQKPSSDRKSDDKRSSSSRDKDRNSSRSSKDKRDSKSSSHRSDKDKKSSSSKKHEDKDKKKDKKDIDDHYSLSGRGNHSRRSTDRDSNDGSSSSKGSHNQPSSRIVENKKEGKESSTKSSNTSSESSPSDSKEVVITNASNAINSRNQQKPIRVENHLETPITSPPRLPFVPDVTLKKPKFAANLEEAKRMMKMRRFLDEEQKRMNQEAALLLEFQANVRPSLSQVYSSIPGPELEFACIPGVVDKVTKAAEPKENKVPGEITTVEQIEDATQNESNTDPTIDENEEHTYNENKPFSQLMDEITEYSKASEKKKDTVESDEEDNSAIDEDLPNDTVNNADDELIIKNTHKPVIDTDMVVKKEEILQKTYLPNDELSNKIDLEKDAIVKEELTKKDDAITIDDKTILNDSNKSTDFEITIITEELSESEETSNESEKLNIPNYEVENTKHDSENTPHISENIEDIKEYKNINDESLKYFSEQEKYDAEIKRHQYNNFLKTYIENNDIPNKIFVINCNTYEENILKEVIEKFGHFEIINYYKNGHLKLPNVNVNVVKNVNLSSEISLPFDIDDYSSKSNTPVFSPVKSESSFELTSDYHAKLEEMVNQTSRQQVMEIILGNIVESENLTIDYCSDSLDTDFNLKRKYDPVESTENNNKEVTKMRKLSDSDEITSTTEETVEVSNNNKSSNPQRSKYLGRARRVGLPRPRKTNLPNSPSSDKSVENYEQNTLTTPNGKLKATPRTKIQRYDKSDLYKPKLHYLSRRNNIS